MVRAGDLRHRVSLQKTVVTRDDYGEQIETWTTYATVWARISPLRGQELIQAQQVHAEATHEVELRYRHSSTSNTLNISQVDRILFGTRILEIVNLLIPDERKRNYILLCKEVVL